VHQLLQDLYARPEAHHGLGALDDAALAASFAAVAGPVLDDALAGADALAAAWRRLEEARLWDLVRQLRSIDAMRGEFSVAVEAALILVVGDLEFALRLDRVETHAAGQLVIDYKTGDARPTDWLPPRPVDAQLPLYAQGAGVAGVAVLKLRPPVPLLAGFAGPGLADHGLRDPATYARGRLGDWPALTAAWQAALAALAGEFRAGDWRLDRARRPRAGDQFTLLNRRHELGPELADDVDEAEDPA
jgi:RecB family exonuclease